jgi:hypothetical protein
VAGAIQHGIGDHPSQVAAVGVADQQERLLPDDRIDQPEQQIQDGVVAVDALGCRGVAHSAAPRYRW